MNEQGQSKEEPVSKIAERYFKGTFALDLIVFLPIGYFATMIDVKLKIFWLIKAIRIRNLNHYISDRVLQPIVVN